jgi:2-hydroxy-3-oxopropionate reductase
MAAHDTNIGFIGMRNMGKPMARNLIKGGWNVTVYDIDASKTRAFTETHSGATASSSAELCRKCDVVIANPCIGKSW